MSYEELAELWDAMLKGKVDHVVLWKSPEPEALGVFYRDGHLQMVKDLGVHAQLLRELARWIRQGKVEMEITDDELLGPFTWRFR